MKTFGWRPVRTSGASTPGTTVQYGNLPFEGTCARCSHCEARSSAISDSRFCPLDRIAAWIGNIDPSSHSLSASALPRPRIHLRRRLLCDRAPRSSDRVTEFLWTNGRARGRCPALDHRGRAARTSLVLGMVSFAHFIVVALPNRVTSLGTAAIGDHRTGLPNRGGRLAVPRDGFRRLRFDIVLARPGYQQRSSC